MIALKNRNTRPTSMFFDPFFFGPQKLANTQPNHVKSQVKTNILQNLSGFQIELAVPGFKKENFNIEVEDNRLIISLDLPKDTDEKISRKEFDFRNFKKSFVIPSDIDRSKIEASYDRGILSISLIKEEKKIQKVTIQ